MPDVIGWSSTSFTDVRSLPILDFGNGATVSFAGHHLIPTQVYNDSVFLQALAREGLWDNSNFAMNGVPLPNSSPNGATFDPITGLPRHAGAHSAYSHWIEPVGRNRRFISAVFRRTEFDASPEQRSSSSRQVTAHNEPTYPRPFPCALDCPTSPRRGRTADRWHFGGEVRLARLGTTG